MTFWRQAIPGYETKKERQKRERLEEKRKKRTKLLKKLLKERPEVVSDYIKNPLEFFK